MGQVFFDSSDDDVFGDDWKANGGNGGQDTASLLVNSFHCWLLLVVAGCCWLLLIMGCTGFGS